MSTELKPIWKNIFYFNWKLDLFLILSVCIPRFFLVLYANATKNYAVIGIVTIASAIIPFLFLSKKGRVAIGLTKPANIKWLVFALLIGFFASVLLHYIGKIAYGNSYRNWYYYIAQSLDRRLDFWILAIPSMVFSPIGEEFYFRGIVHTSIAKSFGESKATMADGLAFAVTHISHFGLVFINGALQFYFLPTLIWVTAMFMCSLLFFYCKTKTNSLLGAVFCHAAFNFGMIFCIFYLL